MYNKENVCTFVVGNKVNYTYKDIQPKGEKLKTWQLELSVPNEFISVRHVFFFYAVQSVPSVRKWHSVYKTALIVRVDTYASPALSLKADNRQPTA